jgi:hypothetical protein
MVLSPVLKKRGVASMLQKLAKASKMQPHQSCAP